jgi:phosphoenolpyruvate carboxykinase (GTP)
VALTADNEPWWEGLDGQPQIDWLGRPYDPKNGPAAHPNSRFTVAAVQNPAYTSAAEEPCGVPISALIFGGRRRQLAPLVYEARNWAHGVLVGASVASETTAAATGKVGVVRRDPMAMKPFCGYNFGDYWDHWLKIGAALKSPPRIFHVNWFRQNAAGKFLWPGFGENLRVLSWILERCAGRVDAAETPIGYMPHIADLNTRGLDISAEALGELNAVPQAAWRQEIADLRQYLQGFGTRLPGALVKELDELARRIG